VSPLRVVVVCLYIRKIPSYVEFTAELVRIWITETDLYVWVCN
jgi:hypothetical protein